MLENDPGIIPALAGNTTVAEANDPAEWDHPRSRGEYLVVTHVLATAPGSSPLSRGILDTGHIQNTLDRIIPALAGNTLRHWPRSSERRDHPRSRGEYKGRGCARSPPRGSSPLSRGIRRLGLEHPGEERIIPALAGNTMSGRGSDMAVRDHPRSRGEYRPIWRSPTSATGSSPLSRGIQCCGAEWFRAVGIIPALAGNTRPPSPVTTGTRDHPRSRGEYAPSSPRTECCSGSSPLSRGIRLQSGG